MAIVAHLMQAASNLPTDASALQSAISTLESDIKSLESSSVPWERSLPWFTALVALGVAMELWVIWHDRHDDAEAWSRGTIRSPERPSTARFVVGVVSVLLITAGIVGELWVGIRITSINGVLRTKSAELRSKSDQLLALVTQEAGDARTSTETARRETATALELARDVRKEADSFGTDIRSAKETATKAEEHLAEATQRTLRLEQQLSWRTVTPEQTEKLKKSLSLALFTHPLAVRGVKIGFSYLSADAEGGEYAEEPSVALRNALDGFGVEVAKPISILIVGTGPPPKGVLIQVKDAKDPVAGLLQKVLKDAGIDAPGEITEPPNADIGLFVGVMPHPQ